ncbi:hypothetical protein [Tianweitania sediminis]|jgi:hypothetical protein|uniref:Uncharacterized protein n=1 Tax=Tianweitania sediminis TaxID=1502156 RepID=A0A8J7UHK5_9HYPH|nr:hypothetical protein [Tianweitania sediminis]MBP0437913.1 hypothetical protein [Tianweitania sediminis]HEV7414574.1 hypothetical protein [Tianweitania sediminis]
MNSIALSTRNISDVVEQYLLSRRSKLAPISTADATRAIRMVLTQGHVSDQEIEDVVVTAAMMRGLAIHLDRPKAA